MFNPRSGRNVPAKKPKEETKREDYQDYPADYLTCPVRFTASRCSNNEKFEIEIHAHPEPSEENRVNTVIVGRRI